MSKFEKISSQLPVSNSQLLAIQGEIGSANSELAGKKQEIATIQLRVEESLKNEVAKEKEMQQKLDAEGKKLSVKEKEIEEVIAGGRAVQAELELLQEKPPLVNGLARQLSEWIELAEKVVRQTQEVIKGNQRAFRGGW